MAAYYDFAVRTIETDEVEQMELAVTADEHGLKTIVIEGTIYCRVLDTAQYREVCGREVFLFRNNRKEYIYLSTDRICIYR